MSIVWRRLKVPDALARVQVDSDDGLRIKIVAGPSFARDNRLRISGSYIQHVEIGIVSARHPRHAASMGHCIRAGPSLRPRFSGLWHNREVPLYFARLRITRFQVAGDVEIVTTHA